VADPYLTAEQVRDAYPQDLPESLYADQVLEDLVAEFEEWIERYRGVAFTPRVRTVTVTPRRRRLQLRDLEVRSVSALSIDGVAVATPNAGTIIHSGLGDLIELASDWATGETTLTYSYGLDGPSPLVLSACKLWVRREAEARRNPDPGNAIVVNNTELGIVSRESTADWSKGRPSGWLDVDRLANLIPDRRPLGLY
jgi:hypothetical protein